VFPTKRRYIFKQSIINKAAYALLKIEQPSHITYIRARGKVEEFAKHLQGTRMQWAISLARFNRVVVAIISTEKTCEKTIEFVKYSCLIKQGLIILTIS
jgi:hypothetical protein